MTDQDIITGLDEMTTLEVVEFINNSDTYAEQIGNGVGLSIIIQELINQFNGRDASVRESILGAVELHVLHLGGRPEDR